MPSEQQQQPQQQQKQPQPPLQQQLQRAGREEAGKSARDRADQRDKSCSFSSAALVDSNLSGSAGAQGAAPAAPHSSSVEPLDAQQRPAASAPQLDHEAAAWEPAVFGPLPASAELPRVRIGKRRSISSLNGDSPGGASPPSSWSRLSEAWQVCPLLIQPLSKGQRSVTHRPCQTLKVPPSRQPALSCAALARPGACPCTTSGLPQGAGDAHLRKIQLEGHQ